MHNCVIQSICTNCTYGTFPELYISKKQALTSFLSSWNRDIVPILRDIIKRIIKCFFIQIRKLFILFPGIWTCPSLLCAYRSPTKLQCSHHHFSGQLWPSAIHKRGHSKLEPSVHQPNTSHCPSQHCNSICASHSRPVTNIATFRSCAGYNKSHIWFTHTSCTEQ